MFSWGQHESITRTNVISRSEHISSYVNHPTLKPSTRRMNRNDDSTHDTVFQTRSSNTLILRVHLSTQNKAPQMILVGAKVNHPWVDSKYRIIGFPQITSDRAWEESGMKLGDAVSQVVLHLQLNPPTVIEITDQYLKKMQPANSNVTNSSDHGPPSYDSVSEPEPEIEFDFEIPTSFPTLDALSKEEISHLLKNNDAFEEFVSILPSKAAIAEFKSDLKTDNITKAKDIINHKDELELLFMDVESLSNEFKKNMERYQKLKFKEQELTEPMDVRDVTRKLTKAKKEAFEESEELASCWVDDTSEMPINDFVEEFLHKRNTFHERAAKIEMLTSNNGR